MEFVTLKTIHVISVILFLFSLIIKTSLLLLDKKESLKNLKKAILIPDIIIQITFLATGLWMTFSGSALVKSDPGWFHMKMTAVILGVIIAIIAFKIHSKIMAVISVAIFVVIYGDTEISSKRLTDDLKTGTPVKNGPMAGKEIYTNNCVLCHGADGKLGLSGAHDLSKSSLSHEESINIITHGRNTMMAYKDVLPKEDISRVAHYIQKLKE